MRLLAVGNMYPPHHMGGYEILWEGAMRRARGRGHEVRVLTTDHREPGVGDREDDPDVHRELSSYWSWELHDWVRLSPLQRWRFERRQGQILRRHLEEFRPDVVSFWAMGAMSLSLAERVRAEKIPSAFVVIDDWLVYGPKRDAWMRLWSGRRRPLAPVAQALTRIPATWPRDRPERVLACSEFILRRAREAGYTLENAAVVTPGIEARFLEPAPEQPWGWRLLCVGRLDRQKGTDVAIAALEKLPEDATLVIAGSGDRDYEEDLKALAQRLGVSERVRFAGQLGHDGLAKLYGEADAAVFPVRWEEPFGLVPIEAMARGRPVVATVRGGGAEYLRDGENALVFGLDDAAGLAERLRRLAEDDRLRQAIRAGGIETAAANTAEAFEVTIAEEHERLGSGAG